MKNVRIYIILLILLTTFNKAYYVYADSGPFLDPPYTDLVKIIEQRHSEESFYLHTSSNTLDLISNLTPVKSQIRRGTCSIFSAIAMLEAMLVINKGLPKNIDFSEEYLEYLVVRNKTSDGSNSSRNFSAIANHGIPWESSYPYIGDSWEDSIWLPEAKKRCGYLEGSNQKSCLLIHRDPALLDLKDEQLLNPELKTYDPEFMKARKEAIDLKNKYITIRSRWFHLYNILDVRERLTAGIPVTLGIRFYYGAWNHRKAVKMEIGRNIDNWHLGIIGYPEPNSMDRELSPGDPAGHSILIVGYDDEKTINTKVKMKDGSYQTFKYKGVYYFKNSWGVNSFGKDFTLNGQNFPGYGMIPQKHAHEYGGFFHFPI